jgi:hypothetical protein
MSWNDQDIDQLFKGANAPEPPPFEEDFWKEIESQLPPKKRRKALGWWLSGGAAAIVLIAGTYYFLPNVNHSDASVTVGKNTSREKQASGETGMKGSNQTVESVSSVVAPALIRDSKWESPVARKQVVHQGFGKAACYGVPSKNEESVTDGEVIVNPLPVRDLAITTGPLTRNAPDVALPKQDRFYLELASGIGQSYRKSVNGTTNVLHYYALGGGLQTKAGNMVLSLGVNLRVDFLRNLINRQVIDNATDHRIDTRYNQLYSFETPISLGYNFGRNTLGMVVTPGFQTAFSGKEEETQNSEIIRTEQVSGKVDDSKTLTMEAGIFYRRALAPQWQFGCALNADILRPFGAPTFTGQQRLLPLNGQISLRYTF